MYESKVFTGGMPTMNFPGTIPSSLFPRMPTQQPMNPYQGDFLPNFSPGGMQSMQTPITSSSLGQWRKPDAVVAQNVQSPQQQVAPQQSSFLGDLMAGSPPSDMTLQPMPHHQQLNQMEAIDYDVTESSFKGINTDDLNESIKQLSIEPIDPTVVKHEPDYDVPPYPNPTPNPSENFSPMPSYAQPPPPSYQIPNVSIQVPSPIPPSSYSQVRSPLIGELSEMSVYNANLTLQHTNADTSEKLPSFDLGQNSIEELLNTNKPTVP